MTFIVILISLLIERFFDWSHLRYWNVYLAYQNKLLKKFPTLSPYFALAFAMIPLLIIVGLMNLFIFDFFYLFVFFFLSFILLFFFRKKKKKKKKKKTQKKPKKPIQN